MTDRPADPGPLPSCLVLHGLGGGPFELGPLIDALAAAGARVSAPILPGHGGPGPRMPASTWAEWAASAEAGFDALAAGGGPVVVVGFSTGATLAMLLATRRPVARLVLLAPFLAIRFSGLVPIRPSAYLRHLARVVPDLPRRRPAARDPEARRRLRSASPFRTFSLAATLSALDLIATVEPLVPTIRAPTLILQGGRDTVVEPANAAWLARHLGSAVKRLALFPRSDHLLALDHDRDRVVASALAFALGRDNPEGGAAP